MDDTREMLHKARERFAPPTDVMDSLIRRREKKQRNRKVFAGAVAVLIALVSFATIARAIRNAERPADEPTPTPGNIFSGIGGWIAYPNNTGANGIGIWAVNPEGQDPTGQVWLSHGIGWPIAWSSDGTELLILRPNARIPRDVRLFPFGNLFVLSADGTETRVTSLDASLHTRAMGGSLSPDGSKVVYAVYSLGPSRIYVVDASGGPPRALLPEVRTGQYLPTFSPDGSQIAYFADSSGDAADLRVMNADGSGSRVLFTDRRFYGLHMDHLVWSPDGTRLAFDADGEIYTVGADGSGLTRVIHGEDPQWSPDGSRIAYTLGGLVIADPDGTNAQRFNYATSGPWNPLPEASSDVAPATSRGATFDAKILGGAILLALGATFVFTQRRKRFATEP
jgi:hypothetical protein